MWFFALIRYFFFAIDKVVYNFIGTLYDLLISIARTSVLTQGDIAQFADRIYKLLAVFMVFKVTFSLIMYVVNPDDFSDKSKGVGKLGTNIIIALALLILTPYIFNLAYRLQTIILEDNSLATLVFGEKSSDGFFNSVGEDMAFITMSPFFTPNVSLTELYECRDLVSYNPETKRNEFNPSCSGLDDSSDDTSMMQLSKGRSDGSTLTEAQIRNYVAGVENSSIGLMFRSDIATARVKGSDGEEFVMDYKFVFSTVVGIVVVLLLISFCMDVALRSIKLAFLQLIAPIPIISYVDPKSGKDGLFKKWYQTCFKTFLSLFIRLLALYFGVYIISRVADMKMVDIIDGSYVSNGIIAIFIIIGALMFAKQLPKILEGLGIKLDGDGKFTLNPIKKFEDQAIGGKNITGLARGALTGLAGGGITGGLSGAWRGLTSGKGWKETGKATVEMNRKMRQAKLDGSTFGGRMGARIAQATGIRSQSENIARQKQLQQKEIDRIDSNIKNIEEQKNRIKGSKAYIERSRKIKNKKALADSIKAMEDRAKGEIEQGNSDIGEEYLRRKANYENIKQNGVTVKRAATTQELASAEQNIRALEQQAQSSAKKIITPDGEKSIYDAEIQQKINEAKNNYENLKQKGVTEHRAATTQELVDAEKAMNDWLANDGMKQYMTDAINGKIDDKTFASLYKNAEQAAANDGQLLKNDGTSLHNQFGATKGAIGDLSRAGNEDEQELSKLDDKISEYNREKVPYAEKIRELDKAEAKAKANENSIK